MHARDLWLLFGLCCESCIFSSSVFFCLSTEDPTEKERIQQSAECCRKILNHVNEEVKVMENLLVRNTQSITQHTVMWWLGTNWSLVNSFWDLWRSLLVRLLLLLCRLSYDRLTFLSAPRLWRTTSEDWTHQGSNPVMSFILNIRWGSVSKVCLHAVLSIAEFSSLTFLLQEMFSLFSLCLFQNIDLTHKKMLYEGPVTWRVTKEKAIGKYMLVCAWNEC